MIGLMASQPEVVEPGMVVGTAADGPVVEAVGVFDGEVVDAGEAPQHEAVRVELPVLVAVGAVPLAGVVVAFVGEPYGNAVSVERPQLLDETVVEFAIPLAGQEGDDLVGAFDELGAVPPVAVDGVGDCDFFGVAGVPGVLGQAYLLDGGLIRERR